MSGCTARARILRLDTLSGMATGVVLGLLLPLPVAFALVLAGLALLVAWKIAPR